jgi:nicotinamide mononucleotide transporter
MPTLEILATAATVAYVVLAVKRSLWQYPIGLTATALFFFVFLEAKLYSSTALQVLFAAVQIYGWWYWLRGDGGRRPKITSMPPWLIAAMALGALIAAAVLSAVLTAWTDARMAFTDATIFALSAVAQFLVGRKVIENWIVWMAVNALAVFVYASQDLWVTTALYCGLLASCFWGYHEWRNELRGYGQATFVSAEGHGP